MKNIKYYLSFLLTFLFSFSILGCSFNKNTEKINLSISAAASLQESMTKIKTIFEEQHPNITLTLNFGSSGSLQKQIEQGAPCDIFISASNVQMDALEEEDLILSETKKDLLENELVLISSKDTEISDITGLTKDNIMHIGLGEPASVPAGMYAKESLTNLKLYDTLSPKFVFAKDVKEVLSWVSTGNAEAGFVYKSDTVNNDSIKIIETISSDYHTPIMYPIAIVKSTSNLDYAKEFYDYLSTDECKTIFESNGYSLA